MLALLVVPDWLPWVGGFVVVIAVVLAISAANARKRTQALMAIALEIGFAFEGQEWSDQQRASQLKTSLFEKGHARTFRNIMTCSSAGLQASLFDYSFVVGGGKNSRTFAQTVAAFSKSGILLPEFEMRPEGIMQKLGEIFIHKNITFDSHPDFSRQYQLRSPQPDEARELFGPELLSFLESLDPKNKWRLEGAAETLVVYRMGKRVKPEEFRAFLEETSSLACSFLSLGGVRKSANRETKI